MGDIGEVIAESDYKIRLSDKQEKNHDAFFINGGALIQIKATFQKSLGFRPSYKDIHYLGIKIDTDGSYEEIYNGPGEILYKEFYESKKSPNDNLRSFGVDRYRKLSLGLLSANRIPRK